MFALTIPVTDGLEGIEESEHISTIGVSLEPATDFGDLQRRCPETLIIINYLEKGILPVEAKWRRRVEHEASTYFMRDNKLWHRQQSTGRVRTFQQ